ncbi:MAG TPA: acyltransferase [Candidatus Tectomicrobia bacterium]
MQSTIDPELLKRIPPDVLALPIATGRKPMRRFIPRQDRKSARLFIIHEVWEWYVALFSWIPGRTGWLARGLAYRPFLKRAGWPVIFGERVKITEPWNMEVGDWAGIGHNGRANATGGIKLGRWSAATSGCVLNTVSHVYDDPTNLRDQGIEVAPIVLEDHAWLGNGVYVMPGVTIGQGAIVAANSVVTRDIPPYTIAAGSPARPIRRRRLPGEGPEGLSIAAETEAGTDWQPDVA